MKLKSEKRCPQCKKRDTYIRKVKAKHAMATLTANQLAREVETRKRMYEDEKGQRRRARSELAETKRSLRFWRASTLILIVTATIIGRVIWLSLQS